MMNKTSSIYVTYHQDVRDRVDRKAKLGEGSDPKTGQQIHQMDTPRDWEVVPEVPSFSTLFI